jgi:hypothetical protein
MMASDPRPPRSFPRWLPASGPQGSPLAAFLALRAHPYPPTRNGRPWPFMRALQRGSDAVSSRPLLVADFQLDQFVPEATEEKQPKQTCPSHDIQQDIAGKVKKIHHLDDRACDCEREPQRYVKVIPTILASCNACGRNIVYVCHGAGSPFGLSKLENTSRPAAATGDARPPARRSDPLARRRRRSPCPSPARDGDASMRRHG